MSKTYKVTGMTCDGCARAVKAAVGRVAPGAAVRVDLAAGKVAIEGAVPDEARLKAAIEAAGFGFGGAAA